MIKFMKQKSLDTKSEDAHLMLSNFTGARGIARKRFEITAQNQQEAALATRFIEEAKGPNLYVPLDKMANQKGQRHPQMRVMLAKLEEPKVRRIYGKRGVCLGYGLSQRTWAPSSMSTMRRSSS